MKSFIIIGVPTVKDFSIPLKNWESAIELAIYVKLVIVFLFYLCNYVECKFYGVYSFYDFLPEFINECANQG